MSVSATALVYIHDLYLLMYGLIISRVWYHLYTIPLKSSPIDATHTFGQIVYFSQIAFIYNVLW